MEELMHPAPTETKPARDKKSLPKSDTPVLKIAVPAEVGQKIQEALATLKERGYSGRTEDFLSSLWDFVTPAWCAERVEALTPDDFYLEATKQLPEIRQRLVSEAKKALQQSRSPNDN